MTETPTIAFYADNRYDGLHSYREFENNAEFQAHLERSSSMISNSYGWEPNRAAKVYYEAYAMNADIDVMSKPAPVTPELPVPTNRQILRVLRDAETSFYVHGLRSLDTTRALVRVELYRGGGRREYRLEVNTPTSSGYLVSIDTVARTFWHRRYATLLRSVGVEAPTAGQLDAASLNGSMRAMDGAHYRAWSAMRAVRQLALAAGYTEQ